MNSPDFLLALPQHKVPLALEEPLGIQSQGREKPYGFLYVVTDTERFPGTGFPGLHKIPFPRK